VRKTRIPYDVSYVADIGPDSLDLKRQELSDLQKALKRQPGCTFRRAYALGLHSYVIATRECAKVGPGKVRNRLKDVLGIGETLREALYGIETTDRMAINKIGANCVNIGGLGAALVAQGATSTSRNSSIELDAIKSECTKVRKAIGLVETYLEVPKQWWRI
jgi:hypothetical protein